MIWLLVPPFPHPPLPLVSSTGDTQEDGERETSCCRERGSRGWARSRIYRKKARSSLNHSILSAKKCSEEFLSASRPSISNTYWIWGDLKKNGWYWIVNWHALCCTVLEGILTVLAGGGGGVVMDEVVSLERQN
jgi:hypothetical protein